MTSSFDDLMQLFDRAATDPKVRSVVDWLSDICVQEASKRKQGWTFELWKQGTVGVPSIFKQNIYAALYKNNPFELKHRFLDDCHDVLDHTDWHLKVFTLATVNLIDVIHRAVFEPQMVFHDTVKVLTKKFPELPEKLKQLGWT